MPQKVKFTTRQKKFIQFYDGNATQAAIKAGYSKQTAAAQASRLLRNVKIQELIKNRSEKEALPIIASRQERQKFWSDVMRRRNGLGDLDPMKASELLGKSEGDFTERIQHSGEVVMAMARIKKGKKLLGFKVGSPRPAGNA